MGGYVGAYQHVKEKLTFLKKGGKGVCRKSMGAGDCARRMNRGGGDVVKK